MASKTTLDTLYLVNSSDRKINLTIIVGEEGQSSFTSIKLDKVVTKPAFRGNLEKTEIGTNSDLNGKILRISSTISDTSKKTNLTSLSITLSGGFMTRNYPLYKLVDAEGDSADYFCTIEFYNPTS